jgi:hypothetical protein
LKKHGRLVDSLAQDKVSRPSPVLFDQLLGFTLVFGLGLLVIALVWILAYKRSTMWASSIWTEMSSYLAADLAQITAVRKSPGLISPASLVIPAAFWAIYTWFGLSLRQTVLFHWYNVLFVLMSHI